MSVFEYTASVFFVGGTGSKAGSGNAGGCTRAWFDANFVQLSDIMASNGAPLIAETGCSYDSNDSRITKASTGEFAGVEVGMVAYISDGDVDISTDRYRITAVDPSGDWIEVSDIDAGGNATGVAVNIGGAFDTLQNASDYTDADSHDVDIYTNKAETLSATLDLDTGWGNISLNSHKRFEGFSLIPGDMRIGSANYQSPLEALMDGVDLSCCVDIDADDGAYDVVNVGESQNIEFRNLYLHNTNKADGNDVVAAGTAPSGITFINCSFDRASKVMPPAITGLRLISCFGGSDLVKQAYTFGLAGVVANCLLQGVSNLMSVTPTGTLVVINNLLIGGQAGVQVAGKATIVNNTLFNQTVCCVRTQNAAAQATVFDNILSPIPETTSALGCSASGGSVQYNDYNCYYCAAGNFPLDTPIMDDKAGGTAVVMGENAIEVNADFADFGVGDFRPLNPQVLRGGKPDANGKATTIGAVLGQSQGMIRSRMANLGRIGIVR